MDSDETDQAMEPAPGDVEAEETTMTDDKTEPAVEPGGEDAEEATTSDEKMIRYKSMQKRLVD